jgi:hypothetical protein
MDAEFGTRNATPIADLGARDGTPGLVDLGDFGEQLDRADGIEAAEHALSGAVASLGFGAFAYVNLGRGQLGAITQAEFSNRLVVSTNFTLDWKLRYRERRYYNTDPVLLVCRARMIPVTWVALESWNDLPGDARVFDDARAYGMRSGFTVPIHTPAGDVAMVSLASRERPAELQQVLAEYQHNLHLMAFLYHECLERLRRGDMRS